MTHYSVTSLLPASLRSKTTHLRVLKPEVILIDFHGTISERKWEDKIIYPYVRATISSYVKENLKKSDDLQKYTVALREESYIQRFVNKDDSAPVIGDFEANSEENFDSMTEQICEFLNWQIDKRKLTEETKLIERLVWMDGYRKNALQTPIFPDVMSTIKSWSEKFRLKVYLITSLSRDVVKLLLANTTSGDLFQYITDCVILKAATGGKLNSETYTKFLKETVDNSNDRFFTSFSKNTSKSIKRTTHKSPSLDKSLSRSKSDSNDHRNKTKSPIKAPVASKIDILDEPVDLSPRPVIFLTDSGQEAKAASLVADGKGFECILVSRPGNRRLRTYYLSLFPYIKSLQDLELITLKIEKK